MGDRLIEQDLARRGEVLVAQPVDHQERDLRQGLKNIGSAGQTSWLATSGFASVMECIQVQAKNFYHLIAAVALKSRIIHAPIWKIGKRDPFAGVGRPICSDQIVKD